MTTPYYSNDKVTLYLGDALDVLPTLAAGSASAFILDPPYSMVPNAIRGRDDGAAGTSGAPMRLLSESAAHARRVLRPGGIAALLSDWRWVPDVSYLVTLTGLRLTTCVAWTRTTVGTGGMFRTAWDPILIASNGQPDVVDRAAIPNVITVNPPSKRVHPYEKPPALWEHILRRIPTGLVVDPFAGSGASAVAALATGNTWLGVEIDESYCEAIAKRLDQGLLDVVDVA
jgi:site-specific DNA-methyltransferase (adenine-specific)